VGLPKKLAEIQINQSEQEFSQKNYVSYLKSVKEPTIRMGLPNGICRLDPKSQKKLSEHQINQSEQKISQKRMINTLKV
jgi:hypothetical protein